MLLFSFTTRELRNMRCSSPLNPNISKMFTQAISHKGMRLLLVSFAGEPEVVDVYISAGGFRRIAEYRKARANEHARPIEAQREACANSAPRLSVGAPVHLGPVLSRAEIRPYAQVDNVGRQRHGLLFRNLGARISASFLEHAFLLAHDKPLPAVFADNGKNCAVGLERGKSSAVTVLHLRDVHSDFTFALRTYHALRQRVAREEDVRRDLLRLEPHPAWALNERPCAVERIVVPLPPEIKLLLSETV